MCTCSHTQLQVWCVYTHVRASLYTGTAHGRGQGRWTLPGYRSCWGAGEDAPHGEAARPQGVCRCRGDGCRGVLPGDHPLQARLCSFASLATGPAVFKLYKNGVPPMINYGLLLSPRLRRLAGLSDHAGQLLLLFPESPAYTSCPLSFGLDSTLHPCLSHFPTFTGVSAEKYLY